MFRVLKSLGHLGSEQFSAELMLHVFVRLDFTLHTPAMFLVCYHIPEHVYSIKYNVVIIQLYELICFVAISETGQIATNATHGRFQVCMRVCM